MEAPDMRRRQLRDFWPESMLRERYWERNRLSLIVRKLILGF